MSSTSHASDVRPRAWAGDTSVSLSCTAAIDHPTHPARCRIPGPRAGIAERKRCLVGPARVLNSAVRAVTSGSADGLVTASTGIGKTVNARLRHCFVGGLASAQLAARRTVGLGGAPAGLISTDAT